MTTCGNDVWGGDELPKARARNKRCSAAIVMIHTGKKFSLPCWLVGLTLHIREKLLSNTRVSQIALWYFASLPRFVPILGRLVASPLLCLFRDLLHHDCNLDKFNARSLSSWCRSRLNRLCCNLMSPARLGWLGYKALSALRVKIEAWSLRKDSSSLNSHQRTLTPYIFSLIPDTVGPVSLTMP